MVDDKPADGEMVRRYLEDDIIPWNTELEVALSLDDALGVVSEQRIDVLIIDYRFPFGNGFDVLERLRQEGVEAPAVMLTGEGNESVAARAVKNELRDYIPKGDLTPETLRDSLSSVLSKYSGGSSAPTQRQEPTDQVDLAGLNNLLATLSDRNEDSESLAILALRLDPKQFAQALDLKTILDATFGDIALETITFYRLHVDVVVALLRNPLPRTISLENPLVDLPDRLEDVIAGSLRGSEEDSTITVRGGIVQVEHPYRDPAALLNDALDELRHTTEEERDRLVHLSVPVNHE